MNEWAAKRFWITAEVASSSTGWRVELDGRVVKTPGKATLTVPTQALASVIAEEWQAQEREIDPLSMPATRCANSAIDKVAPQRAEVAAMIAAYGETDLICYRADSPVRLVQRQSDAWDPLLDWARETFGAELATTVGVMPVAQDPLAISLLSAPVARMGPFQLAAFHDLVSLSGSLILGLALVRDRLGADDAWSLSRLDEDWQIEQWGADEQAAETAAVKRRAFLDADRFYRLASET